MRLLSTEHEWLYILLVILGLAGPVPPCPHGTYDGHYKNWYGYGEWCDGPLQERKGDPS